jgi:hypothetical protein
MGILAFFAPEPTHCKIPSPLQTSASTNHRRWVLVGCWNLVGLKKFIIIEIR